MSIVDMDAHPSRYIYKQTAGNLPTDCMEIKRRTQEERSAATREALITGARKLWGYGLCGGGDAGNRDRGGGHAGAMYHQFADKAALFRDVVEVVEQDVMARMATLVAASGRRRRPMQSGQRSMPGSRYLVIRRCVS